MSIFKKKSKDTGLSPEAASQMLSNVFEACDYEANRVPLEVLESYSHYRKERHLLQKGILVVVALLFLMLPVLFVSADVELGFVDNTPPGSPIVQISAKSLIPVESVVATMDSYKLQVYQVADGLYQIHPDRNGILKVVVTLANKQFTETTIQVTNVDVTPPQLVSSVLEGDELTIFFSDDSGQLDFDKIYAVNSTGEKVYPLSWDQAALSVTFAYPDSYLNIFVPDQCNNTLQLVLTVE